MISLIRILTTEPWLSGIPLPKISILSGWHIYHEGLRT